MNTHLREPLKKAHLFSGLQSNGLRIPFPCSHTGERDDTIQRGKKLFLPTAHPSREFWGGKNVAAPNRPTLMLDYFWRVQQAGLIDPELDPIQLIFNIVGLCVFNRRLAPLKERLRDIMGEPTPDPAQVQEQIIRLVLHGALVSQSEGGEP